MNDRLQHERIMYRFRDFLREKFPYPVRKIGLHTRSGCPHRKNRFGTGGCVYCYNPGFSTIDSAATGVEKQLRNGIESARRHGFNGKFIAYFQTESNTYADIEQLQAWWRTIDLFPDDVVGLSIGTRPDCIDEPVLALLAEFAERYTVWLELGLQSAHDRTLELIERGHDVASFDHAVKMVQQWPAIYLCAHIILGLPGESIDDMRQTIHHLNRLRVHGTKLHHLQVVKNTKLADWYHTGSVNVMTADQYVDLLVELLPEIDEHIVIHRLVGDIRDDLLIAPRWEVPKVRVIQIVEEMLRTKGLKQGSRWHHYSSDKNRAF